MNSSTCKASCAPVKCSGVLPLLVLLLLCFCSCAHEGNISSPWGEFELDQLTPSVEPTASQPSNALPPSSSQSSMVLASNETSESESVDETTDEAATPDETGTVGEGEALAEEEDFYDEDEEDFWDDEEEYMVEVADPLEGLNRVIFVFNDTLYLFAVRPVTSAYAAMVPSPIRLGIKNFFYNLAGPVRFINCLLQGKGQSADNEFVRFMMNSTVGILGFGNPAEKYYPELKTDGEDLGQTFAKWGIGNGFFIELPLLGPSTLRDAVGLFGERFMSPVNPLAYVEPLELSLAISGYSLINDLSFRIGDREALKEAALDPYTAFRDAYIQYRNSKVAR